jgi:cerevisin
MATPHLAGLMAYFVEIYGSESFPHMQPSELAQLSLLGGADQSEIDALLNADAQVADASLYETVYAALPSFARYVVPAPRVLDLFAPTPKKPDTEALTPAQIKGLVLKLASKGVLADVKEGTPNLLAFNNATVVVKK